MSLVSRKYVCCVVFLLIFSGWCGWYRWVIRIVDDVFIFLGSLFGYLGGDEVCVGFVEGSVEGIVEFGYDFVGWDGVCSIGLGVGVGLD